MPFKYCILEAEKLCVLERVLRGYRISDLSDFTSRFSCERNGVKAILMLWYARRNTRRMVLWNQVSIGHEPGVILCKHSGSPPGLLFNFLLAFLFKNPPVFLKLVMETKGLIYWDQVNHWMLQMTTGLFIQQISYFTFFLKFVNTSFLWLSFL